MTVNMRYSEKDDKYIYPPTLPTYLQAWAVAGRVEEVVKLLGKMLSPASSPLVEADAVSFNTALMACARIGDWKLGKSGLCVVFCVYM